MFDHYAWQHIAEIKNLRRKVAKNDDLGALSNQKVSALMKKLVDGVQVAKSVNKGRSYFSV